MPWHPKALAPSLLAANAQVQSVEAKLAFGQQLEPDGRRSWLIPGGWRLLVGLVGWLSA